MRFRWAFVITFTLVCTVLHAQTIDSLLTRLPSLDSTGVRLDSAGREQRQKLDSIRASAAGSFDSLKHSYDSVNKAANNAVAGIQHKIDSLNNLGLSTDHLTNKLDSITGWKDNKLQDINSKVAELKSKTTEKIKSLELPPELQSKAGELTNMVNKLDASLPVAELPDLSMGGSLSADVPGINNPLSGQSLPGVPNVNIPDVNMPDAGSLGEVGEQVKEVTGAVPKSVDEVPQAIEQQAGKLSEVGELQKHAGEVDKLKGMAGDVKDPEAMKKQVMDEAKKQAVNHFAGKEKELQEAMDKMAKYKQKYSSVQSIAELPKKRPNEMHGKPLIERLVPGIALQISRKDDWLVDFNPYVGYRFNARLTVGAGWNQRIAYDADDHNFNAYIRIYGPRLYGEFKIAKGFSGRLETEYMNTIVPARFSSHPNDPEGREWVFSTMAGLKKEYRFIKNVKGTLFILYNLYDPHHRSPYADKLNMRIGFEFPMKKKKKA